MESFFFGPPDCQLFGSYHPPSIGDTQVLTVICPPLFREYERTHAALGKLAIALADVGQHVLRFDYRGTGDSFGDLEDMTLSDWMQDVRFAVQEGLDVSGCSAARVLGVRAGALLASASLCKQRDISLLVMWDPIIDGTEYLDQLRSAQQTILNHNLMLNPDSRQRAADDIHGWHLSVQLKNEISLLDSASYTYMPEKNLRVVSTAPNDVFPLQTVPVDRLSYLCDWENPDGNLTNPKPVLEQLFACLTN